MKGLLGNTDAEFLKEKRGHIQQAEKFSTLIRKHQAQQKTETVKFRPPDAESRFLCDKVNAFWLKEIMKFFP